jgi:hypothetical protein
MALLAWDVKMQRRLPYTTLAASISLIVTNSFLVGTASSAFYLAWTAALAVFLVSVLRRLTVAGSRAVDQAPYALGQAA